MKQSEINTIISKIKKRCEKGRSIELTPGDINYLLVHIRKQSAEIERLRAEISHMKDAARRTRPFLSEYNRSTPF